MEEQEEKKQSFIIVRFADVGSVILDVQFENVTSLQVLAFAQYLELKGKNQLIMEENARIEREREMSLSVPQNKVLVGSKR